MKVLVGLVLFSLVSVVFLIGVAFLFLTFGVADPGPAESAASSQAEEVQESAAPAPAPRDGVTITWDAEPSACDGNDKRLFAAMLDNGTPGEMEVTMRILDPAGNFVHQSHVYNAPSSEQTRVHLGGIPSGPSIVQVVDAANDEVIAQTSLRFGDC